MSVKSSLFFEWKDIVCGCWPAGRPSGKHFFAENQGCYVADCWESSVVLSCLDLCEEITLSFPRFTGTELKIVCCGKLRVLRFGPSYMPKNEQCFRK